MSIDHVKGLIVDCLSNVYPSGLGSELHIPRQAFRDADSLAHWPSRSVVDYLMRDGGLRNDAATDPVAKVEELDRLGVAMAQVYVACSDAGGIIDILGEYPDRFFFGLKVDPHEGTNAVRDLERLSRQYPGIRSCVLSPYAYYPSIPPSSKEYYPIYAKCVELGIPIVVNVGVPGPRVLSGAQDPLHLDEVCWFFPELTVVMQHMGEPWVEMCIKLMLKWPNLYYTTSAFMPRYYSDSIIHYANTRGTDRIIFASGSPSLPLDEVIRQFTDLPLREHVWSALLSDNARRVFRLRV